MDLKNNQDLDVLWIIYKLVNSDDLSNQIFMEKDAVSLFQSWKGQMVNVPLDIFRAIKLGPEGDDGWKGMTREFIEGGI